MVADRVSGHGEWTNRLLRDAPRLPSVRCQSYKMTDNGWVTKMARRRRKKTKKSETWGRSVAGREGSCHQCQMWRGVGGCRRPLCSTCFVRFHRRAIERVGD
uniref:Uncharacterized protein n=1 Tax=Plectus sambesii TaxID=2011161 RepID=A0A914W460_9BILA